MSIIINQHDSIINIYMYFIGIYIYAHVYISSLSSSCSFLLTFKKGYTCWRVCVAIISIVTQLSLQNPRLGVPH